MTKEKPEFQGVNMKKDELRPLIVRFLLESKEHFLQLHGGRGSGKSYTTQKTIIQDCLLNNREFCVCVPTIKLRDHGALKKWVSKVLWEQFPNYQTKFTVEYMYMREFEDEDWQLVGRCLPLSNVQDDAKNDSSIFRVDWMIWDEAMKMNLDIHAAEILLDQFLLAYHTIDRDENRVKAVFMGNALNKTDPLYTFFDVGIGELKKPGIIKRSFNKISWYVPIPPDIKDNENNTFRKMIAGTRYGEIASGEFNLSYGYLIEDPGDVLMSSCYSIEFTDDGFLLIMSGGGKLYIESCDKAFSDKYATSKFTTQVKEATKEKPVVPPQLLQMLRSALTVGCCKFVDEESLLTGAARLKTCYNIAVL